MLSLLYDFEIFTGGSLLKISITHIPRAALFDAR